MSVLVSVKDLFENRNTQIVLDQIVHKVHGIKVVSARCLKGRTKVSNRTIYLLYVKYKQFMEMTFSWLFNVQLFTSKIIPEVGEMKHLNDSV